MAESERISKIEELKSELKRVGSDRIFAGLRLKTEEAKIPKDESLIHNLRIDFESIENVYSKVLSELRSLQHGYYVEIEYYSRDMNDKQVRFTREYELHLTPDIQIDTINDLSSIDMDNPLVQSLFSEIFDHMKIYYTDAHILKIKRFN